MSDYLNLNEAFPLGGWGLIGYRVVHCKALVFLYCLVHCQYHTITITITLTTTFLTYSTTTADSGAEEGMAELGVGLSSALDMVAEELRDSATQSARQERLLAVLGNKGFYTAESVRLGEFDHSSVSVSGAKGGKGENGDKASLESATARVLNLRNTQLRSPGKKLTETGTLLVSILTDLHTGGVEGLSPALNVRLLHELAVRTLADVDAEVMQVAATPGLDLQSELLEQHSALSKLFHLSKSSGESSESSGKSIVTRLGRLKGRLSSTARKSAESFELLQAMFTSLMRSGDNSDHPAHLAQFVETERSRGSPIAAVFEEVYMAISSRFYVQDFLGSLERDKALSCYSLLQVRE